MKNKALDVIAGYMAEEWGQEKADRIAEMAEKRLAALCKENAASPKAVKAHTEKEIFPCISLYEALQKNGFSAPDALAFLDKSFSRRAEPAAAQNGKMLHAAGLYKLYPAIFRWVAKHQFGEAAGFQATFYKCGKQHCRFDMTKCIYLDTCSRYGYPELTACFCHVDDVNNGNLHPRLCWNRTMYMGKGDPHCDFDIFVTDQTK